MLNPLNHAGALRILLSENILSKMAFHQRPGSVTIILTPMGHEGQMYLRDQAGRAPGNTPCGGGLTTIHRVQGYCQLPQRHGVPGIHDKASEPPERITEPESSPSFLPFFIPSLPLCFPLSFLNFLLVANSI